MSGRNEKGMAYRSQRAFIARTVGIVCIALGFVAGMSGLDQPDSIWLQTGLGLIATGMIAQAYALYCSIRRARNGGSWPNR